MYETIKIEKGEKSCPACEERNDMYTNKEPNIKPLWNVMTRIQEN